MKGKVEVFMIPSALTLRACLRTGVGPQIGEVTRLSI